MSSGDDLDSKDIGKIAKNVVGGAEQKVSTAAHDAVESVSRVENKIVESLRQFLNMTASGGIVLVIASIAAIIIANSGLNEYYHYFLNEVYFRIGFSDKGGADFEVRQSLLHWVNDGLMAMFFFLVGLEIKREVLEGNLSSRERVLLPALAAVGGMVVPALVYWYINKDNPAGISGWAVPAATDIAFALAVLGLLGTRAPTSLKVLLTAIAVIDDIGAIIIIALFYGGSIQIIPLYFAGGAILGMFLLQWRKVCNLAPYLLLGIILWLSVLESGVHATLAGVVAALFIPMRCQTRPGYSPVKSLEHNLHPWISFGVLPLFGFANAGVPFHGLSFSDLFEPVTFGIIAGLFIGKQLGVFTMLFLTVKLKLSPKPEGATWVQLYAVSILCGIGFTMSLFIGSLAFSGVEMQASLRLGVMIGSVLSAVVAFVLLFLSSEPKTGKVAQVNKPDSDQPTLEDFE